jgi:adenylyltransferase/sulfurtransferase
MSVTPIAIPDALLREIAHHARTTFPFECCGYLTGPRGEDRVDAIVRCTNAQADVLPERGAESSFAIDGAELFAFARSLDGPQPARVVYHSHPNGGAYFSALDRDVARRGGYPVQHLVVGLTAGGTTEAALFAELDGDFVDIARWPKSVLG